LECVCCLYRRGHIDIPGPGYFRPPPGSLRSGLSMLTNREGVIMGVTPFAAENNHLTERSGKVNQGDMSKTLCVLLIEDSEDDALLLLRELRRGGYAVVSERVQTEEAMQS